MDSQERISRVGAGKDCNGQTGSGGRTVAGDGDKGGTSHGRGSSERERHGSRGEEEQEGEKVKKERGIGRGREEEGRGRSGRRVGWEEGGGFSLRRRERERESQADRATPPRFPIQPTLHIQQLPRLHNDTRFSLNHLSAIPSVSIYLSDTN